MYKKENLYFIALIPKRDLREKIDVFKNDLQIDLIVKKR